MKFLSILIALTSLIALAASQDVSGSTGASCSGTSITLSKIDAAAELALDHLNAGTQVGSNDYPHQFNNREGFKFNAGCSAPYYEFPVLSSGPYSGGSPGADRVVIGSWDGTNAVFCDAITHTGASGNNFLQCTNT
ncbi:Ribonuclease/ribotoxin [Morchella snyderi]|nr:Ribonuclease/ribotoxin [Morchella snyderi]